MFGGVAERRCGCGTGSRRLAALVASMVMLAGAACTRAHPEEPGDAGRHAGSGVALEVLFPEGVASLDGSGNNLEHPGWGMADAPYSRVAAHRYADGIGSMVRGPAPRYVSNRIFNDTNQNLFSENGVTQWGFAWGQFIDHNIGLRQSGGQSSPIRSDLEDPLEAFTNDFGIIDFERTPAAPGTGVVRPREQINTVSSFIDAWAVYGGTDGRLEWLREGPVDGDLSNNGARLLTSSAGYLPRASARGRPETTPEMQLMGPLQASPQRAVVAGDVRANENIALTAIHTLFVREHNRIVDVLPAGLPEELKFQVARRLVMAEIQHITYTEFLPALGIRLDSYAGYAPDVDATLSNEFAVVGYRAHSMIHGELEGEAAAADYSPEQLEVLEAHGVEITVNGENVEFAIPLNLAFGSPDLLEVIGLDAILLGLGRERQYKNDEMIDNQLRSVLFQVPGLNVEDSSECLDGATLPDCFQGVLDLGAIDIKRGRDHGIPSYNDLRVAYGIRPVRSFAEITGEDTDALPKRYAGDGADPLDDPGILRFVALTDLEGKALEPGSDEAEEEAVFGSRTSTLAARLRALYGTVNDLDAFVGMVSEAHVTGSEFGPLQRAIWTKQFEAIRDGDRFFYLNDPSLELIEQRFGITYAPTLSRIIVMNTDVDPEEISENVFAFSPEPES